MLLKSVLQMTVSTKYYCLTLRGKSSAILFSSQSSWNGDRSMLIWLSASSVKDVFSTQRRATFWKDQTLKMLYLENISNLIVITIVYAPERFLNLKTKPLHYYCAIALHNLKVFFLINFIIK